MKIYFILLVVIIGLAFIGLCTYEWWQMSATRRQIQRARHHEH